jgi:hypothetical protein
VIIGIGAQNISARTDLLLLELSAAIVHEEVRVVLALLVELLELHQEVAQVRLERLEIRVVAEEALDERFDLRPASRDRARQCNAA